MVKILTSLTLVMLLFIAGCGKSEQKEEQAAAPDEIVFTENELYPEGVAYDMNKGIFYVTSLHYGTIGMVDWDGNYTPFITDDELPSIIGIEYDEERNRILACVSDPGVSVYTVPEMQRKTAKLAVFDAASGEQQYLVDLGAMNDGYHFANDIALDPDGNAYITDSFSPYIYKVTPEGIAEVFATDERWIAEGFGLNGIVYHPDGFLLVGHAASGILYKIELGSPDLIEPVESDNSFKNVDGMTLIDGSTLALVQNEEMEISRVISKNGWKSAQKDRTVVSKYSFPTTMTQTENGLYILNAKLNEIFNPETPLTSDFMLQKAKFE